MPEKNKNARKDSVSKRGILERFARKVLEPDRPLTMKERVAARKYGDEHYLKLTDPSRPKNYVQSEKVFKERQASKRRIETAKRFLNKK